MRWPTLLTLLALAGLGAARAHGAAATPASGERLSRARATAPVAAPLSLALVPPARGTAPHGSPEGITRCELCHSAAGWDRARFAHERTGFPLEGAHQDAPCRGCHEKDLSAPVAQLCAGCHRDPHAGEFGMRCEGCHDPGSWRTTAFSVDAHRRTAFPLSGRHATLPCTECHTQQRERRFSQASAGCVQCHQADYERAALVGGPDHAALGFSPRCEECHAGASWRGARYPGHERCFELGRPHASLRCAACHTSLQTATPGRCNTGGTTCTSCHAHACGKSDAQHEGVPGYECRERKCYECHQFGTGG